MVSCSLAPSDTWHLLGTNLRKLTGTDTSPAHTLSASAMELQVGLLQSSSWGKILQGLGSTRPKHTHRRHHAINALPIIMSSA